MKNEPLTAEDVRLVQNQINAALDLVKSLREYLEKARKLQSAELRQFGAAENALHAIRIKPSPPRSASRASTLIKRVSPPSQKP